MFNFNIFRYTNLSWNTLNKKPLILNELPIIQNIAGQMMQYQKTQYFNNPIDVTL